MFDPTGSVMDYHYTWQFAKYFEPVIGWLHRNGLFNFYVHVTAETALAILLFLWVFSRVKRQLDSQSRFKKFFWYSIYFSTCWVATASFGVGLKTMIVEELDYQERKWFEPYLAPAHLYISSAAFAYIAFVTKTKQSYYSLLLALYVQIALVAGYFVAAYRMAYEDIEGAIGGALLFLFFAVCNYDLISKAQRILSRRFHNGRSGDILTPSGSLHAEMK